MENSGTFFILFALETRSEMLNNVEILVPIIAIFILVS